MKSHEDEFVTAKRIAAGVAALAFGAYAIFLLRQLVQGFQRFGFDSAVMLLMFDALAGTFVCSWFALRAGHPESRRQMRITMRGGVIGGGIGFVLGFVGPAVFTPESNQGPLLGIFLTAPLGAVLGAAIARIASSR